MIDETKSYSNKTKHVLYKVRLTNNNIKKTKKFITENNLLVTRADEGNVTVILKYSVYIEKMEAMLPDTDTYLKLNYNPLDKLQKSTTKIMLTGKNNGFLQKKYHPNQITWTNTNLAKFYGLPKIHKENNTMICSK